MLGSCFEVVCRKMGCCYCFLVHISLLLFWGFALNQMRTALLINGCLCCNLEMFWSNWCHYNHVLSRCYHFCMNTIHVVSLFFYCSITKIQLIKLDIRFQLLRTLPAENYLLQQLHAWYELQVCLYWVHKCVCAWVFDPLAAHHDRLMPYFLLRRLNAIVIATWARRRAIVDLCILGAGSLLVFLACFPTHFSR